MYIEEPRPSSYSILPVDFVRLTMAGRRKRVCPRLNCVSDNDWKGRFSTQSRCECYSVNRPKINALILFWCLRMLTFSQHFHLNERNNSLILIFTKYKFYGQQRAFATVFQVIFRPCLALNKDRTRKKIFFYANGLIVWLTSRLH